MAGLVDLPIEIRFQIFSLALFVFTSHVEQYRGKARIDQRHLSNRCPLFHVCRQIRDEALYIFYSEAIIAIPPGEFIIAPINQYLRHILVPDTLWIHLPDSSIGRPHITSGEVQRSSMSGSACQVRKLEQFLNSLERLATVEVGGFADATSRGVETLKSAVAAVKPHVTVVITPRALLPRDKNSFKTESLAWTLRELQFCDEKVWK